MVEQPRYGVSPLVNLAEWVKVTLAVFAINHLNYRLYRIVKANYLKNQVYYDTYSN